MEKLENNKIPLIIPQKPFQIFKIHAHPTKPENKNKIPRATSETTPPTRCLLNIPGSIPEPFRSASDLVRRVEDDSKR